MIKISAATLWSFEDDISTLLKPTKRDSAVLLLKLKKIHTKENGHELNQRDLLYFENTYVRAFFLV